LPGLVRATLPPLRSLDGPAFARVFGSSRKDPEKVGKTGPAAGPDNGRGPEGRAILWLIP